jgi:hypothetical protein
MNASLYEVLKEIRGRPLRRTDILEYFNKQNVTDSSSFHTHTPLWDSQVFCLSFQLSTYEVSSYFL